jgi:uncharacterized protein (TIGR00730 family)
MARAPKKGNAMAEVGAFENHDLMWRDELRPTRLASEFLAAELMMTDHAIRSTVVVFGSARARPGHPLAPYLEVAEDLAYRVTRHSQALYGADGSDGRDFVICTGGGPGLMEAANKGAQRAGGPSIGLNIELPREQAPNGFITPGLNLRFHYFAMRKMHLIMRARALVIFPGGFGTLDELFEALTLIQTEKITPIPVIMFGRSYWERVVDIGYMAKMGAIAPGDADLIRFADDADDGLRLILEDAPGAPGAPSRTP